MRFALALLVLSLPASVAQARDVTVDVHGCADLTAPLADALALELGRGWRVTEQGAGLHLQMTVPSCHASRWTVRLALDGDVVAGPDVIALDEFAPTTRPRVAALWAAERLAELGARPGRELSAPDAPVESVPAEPVAPTEPEPIEPPDPHVAELTFATGPAYLLDPANLSNVIISARAGLYARVVDWLLLGGSFEGGVTFEPFGHAQPLFRLCAEPLLSHTFDELVRLEGGVKLCASTSRHIWGGDDWFTWGLAAGGIVRLGFRVTGGFELGVRIDADAWDRDVVVGQPQTGRGTAPDDFPLGGVFGAAVEARVY